MSCDSWAANFKGATVNLRGFCSQPSHVGNNMGISYLSPTTNKISLDHLKNHCSELKTQTLHMFHHISYISLKKQRLFDLTTVVSWEIRTLFPPGVWALNRMLVSPPHRCKKPRFVLTVGWGNRNLHAGITSSPVKWGGLGFTKSPKKNSMLDERQHESYYCWVKSLK